MKSCGGCMYAGWYA